MSGKRASCPLSADCRERDFQLLDHRYKWQTSARSPNWEQFILLCGPLLVPRAQKGLFAIQETHQQFALTLDAGVPSGQREILDSSRSPPHKQALFSTGPFPTPSKMPSWSAYLACPVDPGSKCKESGCLPHPIFPALLSVPALISPPVSPSPPKLSGIGNIRFIGLASSSVRNLDRTHRVACLSLFHDIWNPSSEDASSWELESSGGFFTCLMPGQG